MLEGKNLLDLFTYQFYNKNDKAILKDFQLLMIYFMNRFQRNWLWKKPTELSAICIENWKT